MKVDQKTYSIEQVNELKEWFETQDLPQDMHIDKATYSPDLKDTLDMLFEQAYICYNNPKMQGCFFLLEKIKSNLEKKETGA